MATRLLKDVLAEKLEKATKVNCPEGIEVSTCKTYTNSVIKHTRHGLVRHYVVTEV